MSPDQSIMKMADDFKVLSDFTRLKLLEAIKDDELCVCDLAYLLKVSKSAISHQLTFLKKKGWVIGRREGKMVYYSLTDEKTKKLIEDSYQDQKELIK